MRTHKLSIFVLLTVMVLALSVSVASAQDQVTIDWWHISTQEDQAAYWQSLADAFTAENPNVTINITVLENAAFKERLNTVMQANDPPDLFQSWGGAVLWNFAENGLVRNIAPELEGEWYDSLPPTPPSNSSVRTASITVFPGHGALSECSTTRHCSRKQDLTPKPRLRRGPNFLTPSRR
jgi:ABC-type glycerol-3-phosphate transport system substrate-binding protein